MNKLIYSLLFILSFFAGLNLSAQPINVEEEASHPLLCECVTNPPCIKGRTCCGVPCDSHSGALLVAQDDVVKDYLNSINAPDEVKKTILDLKSKKQVPHNQIIKAENFFKQ